MVTLADPSHIVLDGAPGWQRGVVVSVVGLINEVNQRWARLVPGWVTAFVWANHPCM